MQILNTYTELSLNTWETMVFQCIRRIPITLTSYAVGSCTVSISAKDLKILIEEASCSFLLRTMKKHTVHKNITDKCIQDVLNAMNSVIEQTTTDRIKIICN